MTDNWQQRVIAEHAELADRITKLSMYKQSEAFRQLGPRTQRLMTKQHMAMEDYAYALSERIREFQS